MDCFCINSRDYYLYDSEKRSVRIGKIKVVENGKTKKIGFGIHLIGFGGQEPCLKLNFCPFCGRKL